MASATVDHRHLRLDSLPLVDLRLLSQSDLYSLSLSSSTSSHRCGDDDVLIPKIDRSVFNESAGSRKQTYSRLRLAPRNSQLPSSSSSSASRHHHQTPEPLDQESFHIIGLLKQLFSSSSSENRGGELVPVPVDYNDSVPESSGRVVQNVPIDVLVDYGFKKRKRGRPRKNAAPEFANEVKIGAFQLRESLLPVVPVPVSGSASGGGGSQGKRKRGRPRKNENRSTEKAKSSGEKAKSSGEKAVVVWDGRGRVGKKEEEVVVNVNCNWNGNGNGVDLVALGNLEDPFGEVLRRRTQGLETEEELLGFLGGLEGEWGSWRRKKKIVLASEFGDVLPNGWRVMISLKRKEGRVSLFCRRYISPNGQQFVSCKEVSSYLLSSFELQDAGQLKPVLADSEIQVAYQVGSGDDGNLSFEDAKNANELLNCSILPITSVTDDSKQSIFLETRNPGDVQIANGLKCHHHAMNFDEKNDLVHHLFSSHKDANGCNSSFCEGVIFKDGNYECQFCHKIFDENVSYNGRVAVHAKDDVESFGISQGLTNMLKNSEPSLSVTSPISLQQMQESIEVDEEQPSTVAANDELSCGFVNSKLKADTVIQTFTDRDGLVSFSHEEQVTDGSKDKKDKEICEKQAHMTNDELGSLDEAIEVAKTVTFNNENKNTYEFSDGIDVNCISISSMEKPKLDIDPQAGLLASIGEEKICSSDDIEYRQITGGVENGNTGSISGNCGPWNVEECGPKNVANGFLASVLMDSVHERSIELSSCSSFIDEKTNLVGNGVNVSSSTFYESEVIGSSSNHVTSDTDAVTGRDHGRGSGCYLRSPPLNEQGFVALVNSESPTFKMEEAWQERSSQSNVFIPFVDDSDVNKSSLGAVDVINCKDGEFSVAFDSKDLGIHSDTISCVEREENAGGDSLLSSSCEHKFASKDSLACNRKMEEARQERDFPESDLLSQFEYEQNYYGIKNVNNLPSSSVEDSRNKEVKRFWNSEILCDFGSSYTVMAPNTGTSTVEGRSSEGYSLVISGSNQTFSITNNVPDICSSTVEELKLKRGSEIGDGSEQIHAIGDNLKSVSDGVHWQQPKSEDATKSRNNELMTDSEKHAPICEVMPEHIWRTDEQNFQFSRLADTSSASMELSSCYLNSNILSDQDAYEDLSVDEKFESISGLEELRSGSTEQLQANFLTAQGTSNSTESKDLSHTEMNQGFDSSFWLAKEASDPFPKTATTHQTITCCVWCRKEFYHQGFSSGTKLGSVGIMCATCQARFSG